MRTKRFNLISRIIVAFVIIFDVGAVVCYMMGIYNESKQEAYQEILDFSNQVKMTTNVQMEGCIDSLYGMSSGFASFKDIHSDSAIRLLKRLNESTNFTRMCIVTPNGEAVYHDGLHLLLGDRDYVMRGLKGESGISPLLVSRYSGEQCFMAYAPIYAVDRSIKGVLCGTFEPGELQKVIGVKSFDHGGGTYLYERNGAYITSSSNPGQLMMGDDTIQNFLNSCKVNESDIQKYLDDLEHNKGGYLDFTRDKVHYIGYYQPVGIGEWYLMCVTSNSTILLHIQKSFKFSMVLLLAFMVTMITIAVFVLLHERQRRRAEVKKLEDQQSRLTEQYAHELRSSYDAVFEFDYGNNRIYSYKVTEDGFERVDAKYPSLDVAIEALEQDIIINTDIGNIREFFSRERVDKLFLSGRTELTLDVQRRNQEGTYNWYSVCLRKIHWRKDSDQVAMFYAKNVDELYREQRQNNQLTLDALKMAKEASHAKSDFLARMSHDIRTPMNAIMGMTSIAKSHLDDQARLRDCIEKIESASQYLLSLINDVLDMSRIESGKMELQEEEVSFNQFFEEICELIRPEAEKKEITLLNDTKQEDEPVVIADKLHLQQIFMNLLSNAVKFTHNGGRVVLSARRLEESATHTSYRITVCDTGVGIVSDKLDKIFQPFERADEDHQRGTGLGLSIAQNLLTLMNGIITVESTVHQGTTFTVEIPFQKAEKKESTPQTGMKFGDEWKPDFHSKRALLVEDNDINMEIARIFLENVNLVVDTACNGKEALKLYEKAPGGYYQIVVTDIRMPVMDGRELTMRIRKSSHSDAETIPIVAMSADAFSEEIQLSQRVGMNGYVTKPINAHTLYETIQKFLIEDVRAETG